MKTFAALLVLLTTALCASALATPQYNVRRQTISGNGTGTDVSPLCAGSTTAPTLLTSSTLLVPGGITLELATFACASDPAVVPLAAEEGGLLGGLLGGVLTWLLPDGKTTTKTKTKTTTRTTTKSTTKTSTKTTTSVKTTTTTTTATETSVSVSATTATETATAIETVTDSETDTATVTATVTAAPSPTPTAEDVCDGICTTVCAEMGSLPPVSDDCQQLSNAITILNGQIPPEFTVDSKHVQTISFETCRFFFENVGPLPLTYCWVSLVQTASAAASACLPPTQPVLSEGLCIAGDGTWEVGVAHA
ncbi:hypothetical protein L226DRAFT_141221 [Lentinus tigrinus ALCF2SS1-7]|uniref:uncharacterized protein n=1 Tax=Lentinus tigrinus ALCF2SS1-7 TaxID=1328758 RepID=UPI0011660EE7|nr:hypothetical protein L226DRAFT_141221 [Lentinus tigrinus ALCF2SS1-7]